MLLPGPYIGPRGGPGGPNGWNGDPEGGMNGGPEEPGRLGDCPLK